MDLDGLATTLEELNRQAEEAGMDDEVDNAPDDRASDRPRCAPGGAWLRLSGYYIVTTRLTQAFAGEAN